MGLDMAKHNIPYVNLPAQGRDQMEDLKKIFEQVVLKGSFVGTHDDLAALEKRVAEYCGTAEAIALNSGTDALLLAMLVSGIGKGDEVITPPNSFVASTATIVQLGATPVFADVLADQNVDPEKIAKAITPRTKAIMPVHLTGRVCQMDEIMEIANRHGLVVIEDAAQAIGSMYKGRLGVRSATSAASRRIRSRTSMRWATAASSPPTTRRRPSACAACARTAWPTARPSRNGAWSRAWIRCRPRSSATASTSCPT